MSKDFFDYLRSEVLFDFEYFGIGGLRVDAPIRERNAAIRGSNRNAFVRFLNNDGSAADLNDPQAAIQGELRVFYGDFFQRGHTPWNDTSLTMLALLFENQIRTPFYRVAEYIAVGMGQGTYKRSYKVQPMDYTGITQFKKLVFKPYIKPWYNTHIQNSSSLGDETKLLIKTWVNDPANLEIMKNRFVEILISEDSSVTVNHDLSSIGYGSTEVNRTSFINALLNNTSLNNMMEALGFDEYIEQVAKDNFFTAMATAATAGNAQLEALNINTLERALAEGRQPAIDLLATALGATDLSAADKLALRQCALITFLLHDQAILTGNPSAGSAPTGPTIAMKNYFQERDSGSPLWSPVMHDPDQEHMRIYPVIPDANVFDPNQLVNVCTVSKALKTQMAEASADSLPLVMAKYLFWVYSTADGELKEVNIPLSTDGEQAGRKNRMEALKNAGAVLLASPGDAGAIQKAKGYIASGNVTNKKGQLIKPDITKIRQELETINTQYTQARNEIKSGYYYLNDIKITYDGTNPSTARNDVKVEISFTLSSLADLNRVIIQGDETEGLHASVDFRLMDLITLPVTQTTETQSVTGGFVPNQYSPNYSRIRLKVKAQGDTESNLIIDLATIDHQITRDSDSGETKLNINYRGYFESVLNMPENDALASDAEIKRREDMADEMKELVNGPDKCSPETIREALRMQQAAQSRQDRDRSVGSMINRLFIRGLIHDYKLDPTKVMMLDVYVNAKIKYVSDVDFSTRAGTNPSVLADAEDLLEELEKEENEQDADVIEELQERLKNKFFFLGDLMHVALDCLYAKGTATHRPSAKHLNMKFIMGTCYVPNPNNLSGPPIAINPVSIPVDLLFFIEWFNSTIVSKGLTFYPVGTFIRDLIEKLVNGVIYDTCFSLALPDENPPIFRSQVFTTTEEDWFKKISTSYTNQAGQHGFFNPLDPYLNSNITDPNILMMKNVSVPQIGEVSDVNTAHYCVIYQQMPSFLRQMKLGGQKLPLRATNFVPTIFYGIGNSKHNFVSNVSFSKTNSPHLREARYFNTNYGSLSLLSNVYDLSFDFFRRVGNTFMYPGIILNFILTDWAPNLPLPNNEHPASKAMSTPANFTGPPSPIPNYDFLGESNPHKAGTMANIMGMGGYYVVKSVQYILGQTMEEFEIKITTKFLGNDGKNSPIREKDEPKNVEENQNCVEIYNQMAVRVNQLLGEGEESFAQLPNVGSSAAGGGSTNTGPNATPVPQTPGQQTPAKPQHKMVDYWNKQSGYSIVQDPGWSGLTAVNTDAANKIKKQVLSNLEQGLRGASGKVTLYVKGPLGEYYKASMDGNKKITLEMKQ